jgi:hypothetical protein
VPNAFKVLTALVAGIAIAGFQTASALAAPLHPREAHRTAMRHHGETARRVVPATPTVEFPELTCAKYGKGMGANAPLTASRVRKGDPYYIEFRYRFSYAIISGHMYDVFGRLDANGNPITRQYIGLFPDGGLLGLYGGAIIPVPAEVHPSIRDCTYVPGAAYRVSLTASQYRALVAKVRAVLAHPPVWQMEAYNCNHFAAGLGSVAGLKLPENGLLPSFAYIHAFIHANGDRDNSG